jgi:hypothetical protein
MYLSSAFAYPLVLGLLCLGTGLLVDRASGEFLPVALLPTVGAAATIALTQLWTYIYPLAPSTPYVTGVAALAGLWVGRRRAGAILRAIRRRPWWVLLPVVVYAIALAPVLAAGRASFSSYMALADSAVHMVGADYLIHHGQHYAHLDLRNSYGQVVNNYYNAYYPSGADTLYGASALLLGLNLMWAFQPFNAFMLAIAIGPVWLLVRRMGLSGGWAAAATVSAVVPALVYAYELFGSIKEITALALILTLGALAVAQDLWVRGGPRRVLPFALVVGAGVSALGVAFGVWALVAAIVLAPAIFEQLFATARTRRRMLAMVGLGALVVLVAALPTWTSVGGSVQVAQGIAATSNPGNLSHSLHAVQLAGVWLGGSYKLEPTGLADGFTNGLIALTVLVGVVGVWWLARRRAFALLIWCALMLLACLIVAELVTTWGSAKTLMLTSSVVVLLAWAGVAAIRSSRRRVLATACAAALALMLAGGVLASDASQYHVSNLAPTARYEELAKLNSRFAGEGPALFTDFDEYSLYLLRALDVGGPDFVFPPRAVAASADGHGRPVRLDLLAPRRLLAYPLIITRRDPLASRPPAAYRLVYQGTYYQVWRRRPGARPALRHLVLAGPAAGQCLRIGRLARSAAGHRRVVLSAARAPEAVFAHLRRSPRPKPWTRVRSGLLMRSSGVLRARVVVPVSGVWNVWVRGQIMRGLAVAVDGRHLATVAGALGGNSLVLGLAAPIPVRLSAGVHQLTLTRGGSGLEPGDGGAAVLSAAFLTPQHPSDGATLRSVGSSSWRRLCGQRYQWVELSISRPT